MTFEEASQIYYINKEIEAIKLDLDRLEEKRTFIRAVAYSDMPKGQARDATEDIDDYLVESRKLADMLNYSLAKLQQERMKMERFLETIKDSEIRLIIRLRCINNMSWREIGEELNMNRTTAMRKFYKFWEGLHERKSKTGTDKKENDPAAGCRLSGN